MSDSLECFFSLEVRPQLGLSQRKRVKEQISQVLEMKREATLEDITDWFFRAWWRELIALLIRSKSPTYRPGLYRNAVQENNRDLTQKYKLPSDHIALYKIVFNKEPLDVENIFPQIYAFFVKERPFIWFMGKNELQEWTKTLDIDGKVGREYLSEAIDDNFWANWKTLTTVINQRRRAEWKGCISHIKKDLLRQCGRDIKTVPDFLSAIVTDKASLKQLIRKYDDVINGRVFKERSWVDSIKVEKPTNEESDDFMSEQPSSSENKHARTILTPQCNIKVPEESLRGWKNWKKTTITAEDEEEVLRQKREELLSHKPDEGLLKWLSRIERLYFASFIRGLSKIGIKKSLISKEHLRFSVNEKEEGIIELSPILYSKLGEMLLGEVLDRSVASVNNNLHSTNLSEMVIKVIPWQSQ